jgi:hypothetical protein
MGEVGAEREAGPFVRLGSLLGDLPPAVGTPFDFRDLFDLIGNVLVRPVTGAMELFEPMDGGLDHSRTAVLRSESETLHPNLQEVNKMESSQTLTFSACFTSLESFALTQH